MSMSMTSPENDLIDYLNYIAKKIGPVLPLWGIDPLTGKCLCPAPECKAAGKHPNGNLAKNGVKSASSDPANIRSWAERNVGGNWGVACGTNLPDGNGYLAVVDVDVHREGSDGRDTIAKLEMSETVMALTGGNGEHYLYRTTEPVASRSIGPSVDLKAVGGYIVIAPSSHKSGKEYSWDAGHDPLETPIAMAPAWLMGDADMVGMPRPKWNGTSARETLIGEAFFQAGMLGVPLGEGKFAVRCPQFEKHTDGRGDGKDSSTCIFPPLDGTHFGSFRCQHQSACSNLKWNDVLNALPGPAVAVAKMKYPLKPQIVEAGPAAVAVPPPNNEVLQLFSYKNTATGSKIKNDETNVGIMLQYDPKWQDLIKFDLFSNQVRFMREPPWHPDDKPVIQKMVWEDEDVTRLMKYAQRNYDAEFNDKTIYGAMRVAAKNRGVHPVRDWLKTLKWDGVKRVDTWTNRYLGAVDTDYHRKVGRWWLISAVARVMRQPCKADHALILEGKQGTLKSTALRTLAVQPEWFSDTPLDLGNKDAYLSLRGRWIVELAELDSLNRAEASRAKAFFSSPSDTYRTPYGREAEQVDRQCVFAGTVNLQNYLKDATGNRRYWPVKVGRIDISLLRSEVEQLWAEVYQLYLADERWWPETEEERELCTDEQDDRADVDAWTPVVSEWLRSDEASDLITSNGCITQTDVLGRALGLTKSQWDRIAQTRVANILLQLGWERLKGNRTGYVSKAT